MSWVSFLPWYLVWAAVVLSSLDMLEESFQQRKAAHPKSTGFGSSVSEAPAWRNTSIAKSARVVRGRRYPAARRTRRFRPSRRSLLSKYSGFPCLSPVLAKGGWLFVQIGLAVMCCAVAFHFSLIGVVTDCHGPTPSSALVVHSSTSLAEASLSRPLIAASWIVSKTHGRSFWALCISRDCSSPFERKFLSRSTQLRRLWGRRVLLTVPFFQRFRRVGEASHPGPYQYGGSSSSLPGPGPPTVRQGDTTLQIGGLGGFDDPQADIWEEEFSPLSFSNMAVHAGDGSEAVLTLPGPSHGLSQDRLRGVLDQEPHTVGSPASDAQAGPLGDLEWNARLDGVGLTRFGMSPAEIAYRWQARQEADRAEELYLDLEKQWSHLEADSPFQTHTLPISSLIDGHEGRQLSKTCVCTCKPEVESDAKKAAKWRARQRQAREVSSASVAELTSVPCKTDLAHMLHISSHSGGGGSSSPSGEQGRPKRASRIPKILDI